MPTLAAGAFTRYGSNWIQPVQRPHLEAQREAADGVRLDVGGVAADHPQRGTLQPFTFIVSLKAQLSYSRGRALQVESS